MKNIKILFVLFIFLFSKCEKVIDVDVPSIAPKLIIDASFDVFFDENPVVANTVVKLKLSADYFEDEIPTVSNATVFLTNVSDNSTINFFETNEVGNYEPTTTFIPADNVTYELTVIYNNQTYKGKATKVKSTKIDTIIQGDKTLFSDDEIELKISFTDYQTIENYYLFNIDTYNYITIDDTYFNGSKYNFSYFYDNENMEFPEEIQVKLSGVSKDFYNYFEILNSQSGQSGGGPFATAPAALLGNMINTTNEDNYPLGYFHISETNTYTIELTDPE